MSSFRVYLSDGYALGSNKQDPVADIQSHLRQGHCEQGG